MTKLSRLKKRATLLGCLAAVPLAVVGNALYAEDASAAFKLRLTQGSSTVEVEDNGVGDLSSVVGEIAYFGTVGTFTSTLNIGKSDPITGSITSPDIRISSSETSSIAGGTLKIELTDTDFQPIFNPTPFKTTVASSASDGRFDFKSYLGTGEFDNASNPPLAEFIGITGTHSDIKVGTAPTPGLYALTLETVLTHRGAQTSAFDASVKQVPEPFTIMGAAVALGFGAYSKRKFKTLG